MATKKQIEGNRALILAAATLVFIPFLLVSVIYYQYLKSKYPLAESSQRIFDTKSLVPAIAKGGGAVAIGGLIYIYVQNSRELVVLLVVVLIWVCYKMAKYAASIYYGVNVNREQDLIIFPLDMLNFTVIDYLTLKTVRGLGAMEAVPLSDITNITRQSGRSVFIHGSFGSRGISFSNKQKRDECIVAIKRASNAILESPMGDM